MSRSQFVRNTVTAIQMQLQPTPPAQISSSDLTYDDCSSSVRGSDSTETRVRPKRSDSITSWNSVSREGGTQDMNGSSPSVQISVIHEPRTSLNPVYGRGWENDLESLLKVNPLLLLKICPAEFMCDPGNVQRDQKPTNLTASQQ